MPIPLPLLCAPTCHPKHRPDTELSEKESTVLRLIALGYSNKEIACALNVSVKTVETYKSRGMEKLDLHNRVGLVQFAIRCGWMVETPLVPACSPAAEDLSAGG